MSGKVKILSFLCCMLVHYTFAIQWGSYADFETEATNALSNVEVLMSADYTNRLSCCRCELDPTNEMASAALLMLAISDDAKSNHIPELIGNTNWQRRITWFLNCPVTERTIWQRACALTMLSTSNTDQAKAVEYYNCATNTLQQWDSMSNCFTGGVFYLSIARYYNSSELSPRLCLVFSAADSAKKAGMIQQFNNFINMLPVETQEFLRP